MAFNPFHAFRKHQKVIFAILTIVCMIVFILQFGSGDIFQRLLGGGARGRGDAVATLYGKAIYQSDLTRLAQTRALVNAIFLGELTTQGLRRGPVSDAVNTSMDEMIKDQETQAKAKADNKEAAASPDEAPALRFVLMQWKTWYGPDNAQKPPPADMSRMIDDDFQQIAREREATKSDSVRAKLDAVSAALRFQYWFINLKPSQSPYFWFGGSARTADLLDFEIWKHQADRLGIVLTKEDVRKEVVWDAAGRDVLPKGAWKDDPAFKPYVVQEGRVAPGPAEDDILNAIADEYRVSIAQVLLTGHSSGVRAAQPGALASPDPAAPFDFYSFYRKNRTTLKTAFLALPVEAFLGKVAQREPSEEDLQRLYDKYRDQVPSPTRAAPAFKEPRRVEIQYITAKPDSPFYKDAAGRVDAEQLAALQLLAAGTAQTGAGGAASWANLATGANGLEAEFLEQYAQYAADHSKAGDLWVDPLTGRPPELHDPAAHDPVQAAANAGLVVGGALTPFAGLGGSVGAVAASGLSEGNDRIVRGTLAGLFADAAGNPLGAAALAAPTLPASPPPALVAKEVFKELRDEHAPLLAMRNVTKFIEELDKLKNRPDEAKQYVEKAVKDYGFDFHTMEAPKDLYALASDPALKPLNDTYAILGMFNPGAKPDLAKDLTATSGVYEPKRLSAESGVVPDFKFPTDQAGIQALLGDPQAMQDFQSYQQAMRMWSQSRERYVFWRSVDDRAHEVGYDQARSEVVKAWRFLEARKLALAEANRIAAEARDQASPAEAVKYLRDQKDGKVFELAGIARLLSPTVANVGVTHPYLPFTFPESDIPHPPSDLLDRLMGLDKPGQTLLFNDLPQDQFYVAVLEEKVVPGVKDKDFLDALAEATQPQRNQLWHDFFLKEWDGDYEDKLLRQLREEAGTIDDKTGALVINNTKEERQTPQGEPSPGPADNSHGGDMGF